MADPIRRIAITTGGGDAPGLNAVIRAVVRSAERLGWKVFGIRRGYDGLIAGDGLVPLDREAVRGILGQGGTILGTTNRGNPFKYPVRSNGRMIEKDVSALLLRNFHAAKLDAVIAAGGDGSLGIASQLGRLGMPVVGVPKTIDNDLMGTVITFGFDTAVTTATEAVDKLHSTAASHERVFVVEVMGRNAGWIALHSGIAGGADAILIPEIPFDLGSVCRAVEQRYREGRRFAIIVAAEGASPRGKGQLLASAKQAGSEARLGGVAEAVARAVAKRTGRETRSLVLGHLQRGGSPTTFDRLIATRFGAAAVRFIEERRFGQMVALNPPRIEAVPLEAVAGRQRTVPLDGDLILTCRALGICLGDD